METEVNVRLDDSVCEQALIRLDEKDHMELGQPDQITVDSNSVSPLNNTCNLSDRSYSSMGQKLS